MVDSPDVAMRIRSRMGLFVRWLLGSHIDTSAFNCHAKAKSEASGSELKWLMPGSDGFAESDPLMETKAPPAPSPK